MPLLPQIITTGRRCRTQGVDVHQREPGRAVAEQQHHLGSGPRDPRRDRVPEAGAQAAVRAGIEPAARLARLDVLARVADEVAAVADHHGVRFEQRGELAVDPHRVDRVGVAGQQPGVAATRRFASLRQLWAASPAPTTASGLTAAPRWSVR